MTDRQTETELELEGLFYKDCSLSSAKTCLNSQSLLRETDRQIDTDR